MSFFFRQIAIDIAYYNSTTKSLIVCDSWEVACQVFVWSSSRVPNACCVAHHSALLKSKNSSISGANIVCLSALVVGVGVSYRGAYPDYWPSRLAKIPGNFDARAQFVLIHSNLLHGKKTKKSSTSQHVPAKRTCTRLGELVPLSRVLDEDSHSTSLQ